MCLPCNVAVWCGFVGFFVFFFFFLEVALMIIQHMTRGGVNALD